MKEIWKIIPRFANYKVSNKGRVCSIDHCVVDSLGRNRKFIGKILTQDTDKDGYKISVIYNKKRCRIAVHRLVMLTFAGPAPKNKTVNHKDGKKFNNRLKNLEYLTSSEQRLHAISKGLIDFRKISKRVAQISSDNVIIRVWKSTTDTVRSGFNQGHVAAVARGERLSHWGYNWKYV